MRLGCLTSLRMCIYLETLSMSETSTIFFFSSILTATFSPVASWMPNLTLPKVPCPNVFSDCQMSYQLGILRSVWFGSPQQSSININIAKTMIVILFDGFHYLFLLNKIFYRLIFVN